MSEVLDYGILFYRIVENGEWPFSDIQEYYTGDGNIRPMTNYAEEVGIDVLRRFIAAMLSLNPEDRPDPLLRVESELRSLIDRIS